MSGEFNIIIKNCNVDIRLEVDFLQHSPVIMAPASHSVSNGIVKTNCHPIVTIG